MELIRYWRIVYRRWWLPVALMVVVGSVSAGLAVLAPPATMYTATFKFNVGLRPAARPATEADNPLDTWVASEYLMDDLASAVRGGDFARRVAQQLGEEQVNLAGRFGASTEHRVLSVSVSWPSADQLERIANAAVTVLDRDAAELVGPLGEAQAVMPLIEPPVVVPVGHSLRERLDLPIRLGLALLAGVAGAFLLDYLDRTVRDRAELEALGLHVLAEIPRAEKKRSRL